MSLGEAFITVRADTSAFKTELAAQVKAILDEQQDAIRVAPTVGGGGGSSSAAKTDVNDALNAAALASAKAALLAEQTDEFIRLGSAGAKAAEDISKGVADGAKGAEDAVGGLGNALGDLFTKTRNAGSAIENIVNVFKELPPPAQLGLLVVAAGAIEAAFVTAITAVSAAADAALAKIGLTAAGSIEDVRNELNAAFGVNVGQQLSDSLLQISTSSGIAEAALGGVVVQLQGLGLSAPEATGVLNAFVAAVDAAGLHGQGAATAVGALEKAFGSAATSSKFTTTSIKSFSDLLPSLSKTAIVAQLVADGVGKNAAAVDKLLAAGKVTTTQGLTAVQKVAAAAPQTATPSVGGIVDTTKNAISNALGAAFDNPETLAKIQGLATTIQKALSNPKFTAELTKGFGDFADFLQKVLPKAFDLFQKGTDEADKFIKRFGPDIVGLIGDIDGAFTAITTKGTPANDVLQGFETAIGGIVGIVQFFKPLLDALGNGFGAAGIEIKLASDILTGNFSGALNDAEQALKDIGNVALDVFKQVADIVLETAKVAIEALAEMAGAANHIPFVHIDVSALNDAVGVIDATKSALDSIPNFTDKEVHVGITVTQQTVIDAGGIPTNNQATADSINSQLRTNSESNAASAAAAAAASAATSGSKSGGGSNAAQTAAKTLATAAATFKTALTGFTTAIGGAQTVAAVDAAFKTLQSAIDTEDKALGKAEPTGLVTYLAKQKAALDKAASEVELGLSERASFLAQATVAAANPNVAGISGILNQLQGTLARTTEFAKDIKKLQAEGLNQTAIQQLLAVGPTAAGLQAANDLIQASAAQIGQINSVQTQIGQQGENLGTTLAANFKSAGVQAAAGLIDGLKSALPALEKQMTTLASAMDKQIKKDLGIHSPSTLFAGHGANIVAGLAKGINDSAVPSVPTPTLGKLGLGHGSTDNSVTFGPGSIVVNGGDNPKETGSAIGSAIVDVLLARRLSSALAS